MDRKRKRLMTGELEMSPKEFGEQLATRHGKMIDDVMKEWRMEHDTNEQSDPAALRTQLARYREFVAELAAYQMPTKWFSEYERGIAVARELKAQEARRLLSEDAPAGDNREDGT